MTRTNCVSVRLSKNELEQLDQQRGRMPRGAYIRRAWFGAALPRSVPAINADALVQLRGIAVNLNQLTRRTHAGEDLDVAMLGRLVETARAMLAGIDTP